MWKRWVVLAVVSAAAGPGCADEPTEGGPFAPTTGDVEPTGDGSESDVPSSSITQAGSTTSDDDDEDSTGSTTRDEETGSSDETGDPPDDPGDPFDPVPEPEPMDPGALADLQSQIDAILDGGSAGPAQSVIVVDLENDEVIYARNPDTVRVPASNTKLTTTGASIEVLGADHRMTTEVRASAGPDGSGVVSGDLFLMGDHDFTWSTRFYPGNARFPLDRIAARLYEAGVRQVTGSAIARGDFCYDGVSLGVYDPAAHRATAAARFVDALTAAGITVAGGAATSPELDAPAGTEVLTTWWSPPMSAASFWVNVPSHNEFADTAIRHLGWQTSGQSNNGAGGAEMRSWMRSLPTDVTDVAWFDGSGLAHANMASARNFSDMFAAMQTVPQGEAWMHGMAVSGVRGTISGRMTGADTWGRFWGKTGTLPSIGVVTLSGVLYHRHDGRRYAVSILLNGVPNVDNARVVQNQIVEALAVDHRAVGPRPDAPVLRQAIGDPDSTVVELDWTAVDGADGYVVWLSPDGTTWNRDDARLVSSTTYRAGELPYTPTYVRVTAMFDVVDGPVHSESSDVYAARSDFGAANILIVDGNDRWAAEPVDQNPRAVGHRFAAVHAAAIADAEFDTCANEAIVDGAVELSAYDVVLWALGEEGEADETFSAAEQAEVTEYLDSGGGLLVSGAELGYDLSAVGLPADAAFLGDVLAAGYQGDDAGTPLAGAGEGIFEGLTHVGFLDPGQQDIAFPDQLATASGSTVVLSYRGGSGGVAAVARDADAPTVVLGFPFESIDNAADRAEVMSRILGFLGR